MLAILNNLGTANGLLREGNSTDAVLPHAVINAAEWQPDSLYDVSIRVFSGTKRPTLIVEPRSRTSPSDFIDHHQSPQCSRGNSISSRHASHFDGRELERLMDHSFNVDKLFTDRPDQTHGESRMLRNDHEAHACMYMYMPAGAH